MNSFQGHISAIETSDNLSIVTVSMGQVLSLKSIVIDTAETSPYLSVDHAVNVLFKETEVVIGLGDTQNLSLQNRIRGTISEIERGSLLSRIVINSQIGELVSIISTSAVLQLNLKQSTEVVALIKLNEVMLAP